MPVIAVHAPAAAEEATDRARLGALCRAVAEALDLPPDGVVAVLAPVSLTVTGAGARPAWPLAVVHGRARPAAATRAALARAARCLGTGWGVPAAEVWVEWRAADEHEIADPAAAGPGSG